MVSRRESLSLSLTWWSIRQCQRVRALSCLGAHDLAVLAAARPCHTYSIGSLQEGVWRWIVAGNKISYLDDLLAVSLGFKEQYFKMEQKLCALHFTMVLLRTARFCLGFAEMCFEMGSPPFSKMVQHQNKTLSFCISTNLTSLAFVAKAA